MPGAVRRRPGRPGWSERPLPVLWSVAGAALGAGRGLAAARRRARAGRTSRGPCGSSAGVLALWLAWLAVAQARVIGINFLLSVLVLVWVADIVAYFAGPRLRPQVHQAQAGARDQPRQELGRRLGRHGRRAGAGLRLDAGRPGAGRRRCPASTRGWPRAGWWLLVIAAVFLAAMSVVGDLVESLIKRSAGVKDSSQPAAGPRRRARPGRRAAAHLAAGDDAGHPGATMKQRIAVLGSTGSVGANTLDVIARHPDRFEVFALERRDAGRPDAAAVRAVPARASP